MKKTLLFIVTGLFIFALAVTAAELATGGVSEILGIAEHNDTAENVSTESTDYERAYSAIISDNTFTPEDAKDLAEFFAYNFIEPRNQEYILGLLKDGYNKELVKNAVLFWFDTDEDISIISRILESIPETEERTDLIVVETAFDIITNNKSGQLTFQEGRAYLDKGLSIEDLTYANKLSKKGYMDIYEILDKCVEDGSVNLAAADVLSQCQREEYDFSAVTSDELLETDTRELFAAIELCRNGMMSIGDCFNADQNPSEILEKMREAATHKSDTELNTSDEEVEKE